MAICKLCQSAPCKPKAHIIPKWAYGKIINSNPAIMVSGDPNRPKSKSRAGEYDTELVCTDCESKFSPLDTAGVKFFRDYIWEKSAFKKAEFPNGESIYLREIHDVDAALIHKFILSLLWRCSATDRWFFRDFSLGKQEDSIRTILLDQKLASFNHFPTVITRYFVSPRYPDLDPEQFFSTPKTARFDGYQSARISLPSFEIQISTDSRVNPNFPEPLCLKSPFFRVHGMDFAESSDLIAMKRLAKIRHSDFIQ